VTKAHGPEGLRGALADRLSPEGTRRPTAFERLTVRRLEWDELVRLNRYLELAGKIATSRGFCSSERSSSELIGREPSRTRSTRDGP